MEDTKLFVGYADKIVTPPLGIHIPGHGFVPRMSEGVIDDLRIRAVAFSDGENKAVFFECDALFIGNACATRVRTKISERLGIPADHVMIACTHCHTAMTIGGSQYIDGETEPSVSYFKYLDSVFCDLAQFALEDLKPATMKASRDVLQGVGFIRRFKMKDGTMKTNPAYMNPDILEPDGVQDESIQLVRFEREGGKEIVLINFGTHPDVVVGKLYSPDWPGYTVEVMKGALGGNSEVVMINGFCGDVNHCNRFKPRHSCTTLEFAHQMARKVAGAALKIYDDATELPVGKVSGASAIASLEKNDYEEWEVPICEQIVASKAKTEKELPDELRAYKISIKKARRVLNNLKHEGDFKVPVYGLQVGSLAFVGIPGEPFSEPGIVIKENSCKEMTLCSCCTNGSYGYFPTRGAFEGAGYEREYTPYGPNCTEKLAETAIEILKQLNEQE